MKIMDKLNQVRESPALAAIVERTHVLEPAEIRLIIEGSLDRLADFASSSRLNAVDPKGDSPLHLAARMGNIALCDLFVRSGANPASLNYFKETPADLAFSEGHSFAAQLLSSLVVKSPGFELGDSTDGLSRVETVTVGTVSVPEHHFSLVQETAQVGTTDYLDDPLVFEAEVEPEKFFDQSADEAASGAFVLLVSSAAEVFDDENGGWELDLSTAQIVGDGIGSNAPASAHHRSENKFLNVQSRGRQSVKRSIFQTSTRLSIDPEVCISWAEDALAKGWCSFEDVDRLVVHCEGNGDLEEIREILQRNLEAAGFDQNQEHDIDYGLWDARSEISSDDLAEVIEAALTRETRLPGTRRFVMDKSDELQLLEPMVRAKQEVQLEILASEVAVQAIIDVIDSIRDGHRDPASVSLKTIVPFRPDHTETSEFMAAAEVLSSWRANGRVMHGRGRREALVALDALDFSLAFHKELIRILKQDPACQDRANRLDAQIVIFEVATERLICEHLPYVRRFASRNVQEGEEPEDVFQVAFMGLQRSTRRFDPERGYRFLIYATYWMRQAIARWRADDGRAIRIPVHRQEKLTKLDHTIDKLGIRSDGIVSDNNLALELEWTLDQTRHLRTIPREAVYPESSDEWDALLPEQENSDEFGQAQTEKIVAKVVAELPNRQADIIRMRFGIGRDSEMTLEEIGQLYGLTRERIRQIEAKALKVLGNSTKLGRFAFLLEN